MTYVNHATARIRNPNRARAFSAKFANTPDVGTVIDFDATLVRKDESADGSPKTPMGKIRLHGAEWHQTSPREAGLYVFFLDEPAEHHTRFEIVSVIPSNTGCYARLL